MPYYHHNGTSSRLYDEPLMVNLACNASIHASTFSLDEIGDHGHHRVGDLALPGLVAIFRRFLVDLFSCSHPTHRSIVAI